VGSAEAMSKAFGVKLSIYRHSRTHTHFRCPESDINPREPRTRHHRSLRPSSGAG
jgi:hypothetical protein